MATLVELKIFLQEEEELKKRKTFLETCYQLDEVDYLPARKELKISL